MAASTHYEENVVLSDVHVFASQSQPLKSDEDETWLTRFYFHLPQQLRTSPLHSQTIKTCHYICSVCQRWHVPARKQFTDQTSSLPARALDDDGDLILVRRPTSNFPDAFIDGSNQLKSEAETRIDSWNICADDQANLTSITNKHEAICSTNSCEKDTNSDINIPVKSQRECTPSQCSHFCHFNEASSKRQNNTDEQVPGESHDNRCTICPIDCSNLHWQFENEGDNTEFEVLTIEHKMETSLRDVGFQVWSGALLLCDYLIHNHHNIKGAIVLDLGAGTGLTSILCAMFAQYVICTDYLLDIAEVAERNWQRNKDILPQLSHGKIVFKVLDWTTDWASFWSTDNMPTAPGTSTLNSGDRHHLEDATLIIGAEVVYDDNLTDAFFQTVYHLLMKPPTKTLLMSLEKRVVYSSESHTVCSPAYEHFQDNLKDLTSVDEGPVHFTAEKIDTDFPQFFLYKRVKELELWKISSIFA